MNTTHESRTAERTDFSDFIRDLHLPRYAELPDIDLYMDQVLTYIDDRVRPLVPAGEKPLTSSMVNNYVKQRLVPTPSHKRYTRDHLALLVFVCLMKRVVSIADIKRLLAVQTATHSVGRAYDFFCTAVEESLRALFCGTTRASRIGEWAIDEPRGFAFSLSVARSDALTPERRLVVSAATAIANKIYVEKCLEIGLLEASSHESGE